MATEIKILPEDTKEFLANGIKYILRESLTIKRFWQFERYRVMLGMKMDIVELYSMIVSIYEKIPEIIRDAKVGTNLYADIRDSLIGLNDLNERVPVAFYMATLFWSADGENISNWTIEEANKKIDDWNEEGIDSSFFLQTSLPYLKDFLLAYSQSMKAFLEVESLEEGFLISSIKIMKTE